MANILVIVGSNRPNRSGKAVGDYLVKAGNAKGNNAYIQADLAEINLPFLNEPNVPAMGNYVQESTKKWAEIVGNADGIIMTVAEYNHGYTAVLKNAIDTIYAEWVNKPVGLVSYSAVDTAGIRALEQILLVLLYVKLRPLDTKVSIPVVQNSISDGVLNPDDKTVGLLDSLIEEMDAKFAKVSATVS